MIHGGCPGGCATDVESTHRQLCARLANRLGCDNTNSFADIDDMTTRQVAAITGGANTMPGFASNGGANVHPVNSPLFHRLNQLLVEQRVTRADNFVSSGCEHVFRDHPAEYAFTQRFDHIATLNDRLHGDAVFGPAIDFRDDQVLGNIHQAAGQVTGIGCLQRRIGQALTSAVSGDEVLQHVKPFTEVRRNRRFNDRTVRLGHQAAHSGQLPDLGR